MARIRTIKPDFWRHEELSALPETTHMLAAQLLNYADDYGYFNANPHLIQAEVSPLRAPSVDILESLRSLQTIGYLRLGRTPDGKRYGHVVKFLDHQRVSHPTPSKISDLRIVWENSVRPPELFLEASEPELKGIEGKGIETPPAGAGMVGGELVVSEKPRTREYPPDFEQFWKAYCPPRNSSKSEAFKAWWQICDLPALDDHLAAVTAYRRWIDEESARRKSPYPMKHADTWLNERMWESFLSSDKIERPPAHPSWNGHEAALVSDIGQPVFDAWFASAEFIDGDPPRIVFPKESARKWVANHYSEQIARRIGAASLETSTGAK